MLEEHYEVVIVRYGTRTTRRSDAFLNHHFYGIPDAEFTVDYFLWVLRNQDRTIIVDTGFSPEAGAKRNRTMTLHPVDALRSLGVDPAGRHQVIITHGHYDHIGNVRELPNSELLMSHREYEFWTSDIATRRQFAHFAEQAEIDELVAADRAGRLRFVTDGDHPAPGITIMELGGHTPGQLAVTVETSEGPVLLASDAVHFYEELEQDMPFISVADLPAMYAGFDTIRALLTERPHHLVTGHDATTLERFRAHPGELAGHAAVIGLHDERRLSGSEHARAGS